MLSQICSFRMDPSSWCVVYVEAYHVCILFLKHFLHLESKKIQNCWDAFCSLRLPTSTFGAEGSLMRSWSLSCISQLPKSCMFLAKSYFVHVAPRWCTMLNLESINAWILMSSNRKPKSEFTFEPSACTWISCNQLEAFWCRALISPN
jgi:hypothetical protein